MAVAAALSAGCAPLVVGGAAVAGTASVTSREGGVTAFVSDTDIRAQINQLWFHHSLDMMNRLSLTVTHGRVLLTGRASDAQQRLDAVRLVWQVNGVTEVINEIQVDDDSTLLDSARDTWIATQLRTKLLFDGGVSSQNYSIDVVNGVVYLMGLSKSQDEVDRVLEHARSTPYVQKVVNYVRPR
ncbi:osmotically-inducible protein OsmY [Azospirillum fermentarium]|uniref:BON domain-containing protein n=1 Tax=Azospirillum fermentarium TaxID=1233114 RepID=UPI002227D051|nr:BON domain-containing protein [Azospirillum fermentarium]MCW2246969.1 osmotically-inducible protein OsmY [Azospirillum fermentarium]